MDTCTAHTNWIYPNAHVTNAMQPSGVTDMSKLKIDLMHLMFGKDKDENTCKTCSHLQHLYHRSRSYYKCECYGITASIASDWRLKYRACGLYNKPYPLGGSVMKIKKHEGHKREEVQVKGQMELEL